MEPLHFSPDGSRWRIVARTPHYEAGLVYYPAGTVHPRHEHDRAQLTFMFTGGFEEQADGGDGEPRGSVHGYKPAGARHACRFGRDGALILSVNYRHDVDPGFAFTPFAPSPSEIGRTARLMFDGMIPAEEAIDDLVGALGVERSPLRHTPGWLRRAAEQFADDPLAPVATVADAHGVHRVQLSRAFQRHLGISPSRFRLHCKAARAVHLMVEQGESPGMAAIGAGFADQAHLTRTARHLSGLRPAHLRLLLVA